MVFNKCLVLLVKLHLDMNRGFKNEKKSQLTPERLNLTREVVLLDGLSCSVLKLVFVKITFSPIESGCRPLSKPNQLLDSQNHLKPQKKRETVLE